METFTTKYLSKLCASAEIMKGGRKPKLVNTLLHLMINKFEGNWNRTHTRLLRWMLVEHQVFTGLLEKTDEDGSTPLHRAISKEMEDAVRNILEIIHDKKSISMISLLKMTDGKDNNCFHLAAVYPFTGLHRMLDICSEKDSVLIAKNNRKDTPLHIAIKQLDRLEDQLVEMDHGEDTNNSPADDIGSGSKHVQSQCCGEASIDDASDAEVVQPESHNGSMQGHTTGDLYHDDEDLNQKRRERLGQMLKDLDKDKEKPAVPPLVEESQEHNVGEISTGVPRDLPSQDAVRQLIEACPAALTVENGDGRTPYQQRENTLLKDDVFQEVVEEYAERETANGGQRSDCEVDERRNEANRHLIVNDPDAHFIRSYCLRNFTTREETIKRLYKPGQERQFEFDLAGMPTQTIQPSYLKRLEKHLRFESQAGISPPPPMTLKLADTWQSQYSSQSKEQPQRDGRSDLITIFKWLWKNGVREIIKVIVIDDQHPAHADTAIVEALYGFRVVQWDWKRVDLCSDVVCRSSTQIGEVVLYSSGNNAVLMGWASTEGFPNHQKFPNLEKIKIYIRNGLEDPERRDINGDKCKKLIENRSGRKITVQIVRDENKVSYSSELHNSAEDKIDPWIESVEAFSNFIREASADEDTARRVSPIKIAIIDDGVDNTVADLEHKIVGGATFCPYPHSSEYANSYFVPSGRHGTLMAQLICRLCPNVQLFVARLEELPSASGSGRRITASSAAKAVRWAINCGVNIISMSWTIRTPVAEDPDMIDFKNAIHDASNEDILMFCSASDQGQHTPGDVFPGSWEKCIRIGGATFAGDRLTWVDQKVEFWFPGRNVPFRSSNDKTYVYESGSSVATAAASGLAAVILSADQLICEKPDEKSLFQRKDQMTRTFQNMSSGTDNKFPRTKQIFIELFNGKLKVEKEREENDMKKSMGTQRNDIKKSTSTQRFDIKDLQWDKISREALKSLLIRIRTGQ
ncbi:hypothetical protein NW766_005628 [Fusarium irregulare]|uniref:Peptidase S8/S53 domain-containing protein n=1 Tax=Fusarium irregulare TaxID=2494466 RepID=A0A9W8PTH6_9HYPO|nr:hypothetical protein NW766_005628 [Fusarium irregulare]